MLLIKEALYRKFFNCQEKKLHLWKKILYFLQLLVFEYNRHTMSVAII